MTKRLPGITVVIPCLNESETLARAVAEALWGIACTGMKGEVIVADNGSTDGSREIALNAGARVVPVEQRGYGSALDAGLRAARYEFAVFADADLSYPLEDLPELITALQSADLVLGTRTDGEIEPGAMPFLNRHLGTPVLSLLIRLLYQVPVSDCNSGMRALRMSIYDDLRMRCPGMEFASEILIQAAERRVRYAEVPIRFRKDRRNRPPHLRRWRDGWRHLRFILGCASTTWTLLLPGGIGMAGLLGAFALSFENGQKIRFHTAFALLAIALPCLLFTLTQLLVKTVHHESGAQSSPIISLLQRWSEDASPFYWSMLTFTLAGLQAAYLLFRWCQTDFGDLFEMGGAIRLMVLASTGTLLFALDMSMGLLKLVKYEKTGQAVKNEAPFSIAS